MKGEFNKKQQKMADAETNHLFKIRVSDTLYPIWF